MKRWIFALMMGALLVAVALQPAPVWAAPGQQDGGNVQFGPYTLAAGNSVSGDLAVFGGPVTLQGESRFNGNLTVFGKIDVQESAALNGTLVVFGDAGIAGKVDGDVLVIGALVLYPTAHVRGDVSATGSIQQQEGSVVEGDLTQMGDRGFTFRRDFPFRPVAPHTGPSVTVRARPLWMQGFRAIARAISSIVVLSLLALVIVSIWPQQTQRVGRAIEEATLTSFGMGLLIYLVALIVLTILAITICFSLFALLGWLVIGVGLLLGWVALGLVVGKRVLTSVFNQSQSQPVTAAVLGVALLTLVMALTRIFWPIYAILIFVLVPLATGAVALTRFGTMPYATQGGGFAPRAPEPPHPQGPIVPGAMPPSHPSPMNRIPDAPEPAKAVPTTPAGVNPFDEAERTSEEA